MSAIRRLKFLINLSTLCLVLNLVKSNPLPGDNISATVINSTIVKSEDNTVYDKLFHYPAQCIERKYFLYEIPDLRA